MRLKEFPYGSAPAGRLPYHGPYESKVRQLHIERAMALTAQKSLLNVSLLSSYLQGRKTEKVEPRPTFEVTFM